MSVKVYVKSKGLADFPTEEDATEWIDTYNIPIDDVVFYKDEPFDDILEAIPEVKHEFNCGVCNSSLLFRRHPAQTKLNVRCPNCGAVHGITAPNVSPPPKSGDED